MRRYPRNKSRISIAVLMSACSGLWFVASGADISPTPPSLDHQGPGLKRQLRSSLNLPSKPTLAFAHVDPAGFAAALEKNPIRIFEFVRDQIRYEVYGGCLRGPRGTLLALSGNSVDRAALLASLLRSADQRVRFARGTLSKGDAEILVDSMWPADAAPGQTKEPVSELKSAVELLRQGATRDYNGIWDTLKRAKFAAVGHEFAPNRDALVTTARNHYWVQWQREGQWIDLDPSFADAVPGKGFAAAEATFDELPESLFHHVTLRVRIEEYPVLSSGNDPTTPVKREVLNFTSRSADLSGAELLFAHQPENWKGPVKGLTRAIANAMSDNGKVKPVLITGPGKWIAGQPFWTRLPAKSGAGGLSGMLSGEGTRKSIPLAVAEFIDFEFTTPEGKKENVTREVFDLVGKTARTEGKSVTADFVRDRVAAPTNIDLKRSLFDLFITTGAIQRTHLDAVTVGETSKRATTLSLLQCLNVAFAVGSDMLGSRMEWPGRSTVRFYPDSPRVQIAELSTTGDKRRLLLDLRRDHVFAAVNGSRPGDVFSARIFRGIMDGTLERVLVEHLTRGGREKKLLEPIVSTSSIFEQAAADKVPSVLLSAGSFEMDATVPADATTRLKEEIAGGFVAVAPKKPMPLATRPRLAWWRLDPHSGETTAVTDEGLHAASTEREFVVVETSEGNVAVIEVGEETADSISPPAGDSAQIFQEMEDALAWIESEGGTIWPGSGVVPTDPL